MFQNGLRNEPVITLWSGIHLLWVEVPHNVLFAKVLPHWLVTSTLQCIPLHQKMSGYGGMISDILTVSRHRCFNTISDILSVASSLF